MADGINQVLGDQIKKLDRQLAELREQLASLKNEVAELRGASNIRARAGRNGSPLDAARDADQAQDGGLILFFISSETGSLEEFRYFRSSGRLNAFPRTNGFDNDIDSGQRAVDLALHAVGL